MGGGCVEQNMSMTVQKRRVTGLKQFQLTEFQPGSQICRRSTLEYCFNLLTVAVLFSTFKLWWNFSTAVLFCTILVLSTVKVVY